MFGATLGSFANYLAENQTLAFAALVITRVKDRVVNKEMSLSFADCIVDVSEQRKTLVVGVLPVVIAAPITIKVEVGDVIATRFVSECLVKDRREARGNFARVTALGCLCLRQRGDGMCAHEIAWRRKNTYCTKEQRNGPNRAGTCHLAGLTVTRII